MKNSHAPVQVQFPSHYVGLRKIMATGILIETDYAKHRVTVAYDGALHNVPMGECDMSKAEKNARLSDAAPDLLAALLKLTNCGLTNGDGSISSEFESALTVARAAIAKATL